jgi:hypothetical protein
LAGVVVVAGGSDAVAGACVWESDHQDVPFAHYISEDFFALEMMVRSKVFTIPVCIVEPN